jgi:replicative DNA helicase
MSLQPDKLGARRSKDDLNLELPPSSIQAELSVLGGLLIDPSSWDKVADEVNSQDFFKRENKIIFSCIEKIQSDGGTVDAITVSELLASRDELSSIGGIEYITEIINSTPSSANIKAYAEIIRNKAVLRKLLTISAEIATSVRNPEGASTEELLDEAEKKVYEIYDNSRGIKLGFKQVKDLIPNVIDRLDMLAKSGKDITGVPTGFAKLDEFTSGLQRGDLIVIAGRPSMGKTSFAMNIAENASIGHKVPVGVFSMEMSSEQLSMRMLSSIGRINQSKLRNGKLSGEDWSRVNSAGTMLSDAPIWVDDVGSLTPIELRARARRLKREHNLGLIIVDYLQLMSVSGTKENRATEISEISRSLKSLAKELDIPIIALSQLNRGIESRQDKRPVMSDLRESGAIEQDSDLILFIYREEVYDPETPKRGIADIIIGKQRSGPTGDFLLTFLGEYTKFENYIPDNYGEGVPIL